MRPAARTSSRPRARARPRSTSATRTKRRSPSAPEPKFPRPKRLGTRAKFWLTLGPRTLFGDGKTELLELVERLGSLRRAASRMGMSYRYAWGLLRELERAAGFAFLEHRGGGRRTRLQLTCEARAFLGAYRAFRRPLDAMVERSFRRVFRR